MATKKTAAAAVEEPVDAGLLHGVSQDSHAAEPLSAPAGDAPEEAGLVRYRVNAPRGIYLRVGPGRAYLQLAVLADGAEVTGVDLAGMLRAGRLPGEAAWIKVLSKDGSGWVDSAFLERVC